MSFTNSSYRQRLINSFKDRADHYEARWQRVFQNKTPWWAVETIERSHNDAPLDLNLLYRYHWDQEHVVTFIKTYTLAAPDSMDISILAEFKDQYTKDRLFDMSMLSEKGMANVLLSYTAALDMLFFPGIFAVPRHIRDVTPVLETTYEPRSPWVATRAPFTPLEIQLAPHPTAEGKYAEFDEATNRVVIYCEDKQGRTYNLDRLLIILVHEIMHSYLHVLGFELAAYDTGHENIRRKEHGREFWAGVEFVTSKLWQMFPDSKVFRLSAAQARQKRRELEGNSGFARIGIDPSFFSGLQCPFKPMSKEEIGESSVVKIGQVAAQVK